MNVLDENIPASQPALLRSMRIALRQIGQNLGRWRARKGKKGYRKSRSARAFPSL